jgi:hypothetical protein
MEQKGHKMSRAEFERNLSEKLDDPIFIAHIGLLMIANRRLDTPRATEFTLKQLAPLIPGEP